MDQQNETTGGEQTDTQSTPAQAAPQASVNDGVSEHKLWAILGYILPFLFFVPMVNDSSKHNAFARFHANQQLSLLVICLGLYIVSNMFLGMMFFVIMPLINLAMLVLVIMGIIHAAKGEMKPLPAIGGIILLDKIFK